MPSASESLPSRAWLIVGLLWFVGFLNYLDRLMLITMRLSVKETIPMTDAQFGLLTTIFLIIYAVLSPVGGFIADRLGHSRTIIVSLFVWSGITWLTAHATTFEQLLFTRALMGFSEACYLPAAMALIASYHGNATRSLANGIHLSGVMVGSGLGGLGGVIAERHDWTLAFEIFGAIGIAYTVVLLLLLRDNPHAAQKGDGAADTQVRTVRFGSAIASLFRASKFNLAIVFWSLLGVTSWTFAGWLPAFLGETFQLPQGRAGMMATGFQSIGSLVGMLVAGFWADRWSRRHPEARAFVGIIGLAVGIPAVIVVAHSPVLPVTLAAVVLFGLTRGCTDANMMPILFEIAEPRYRATAYGMLNAFATTTGGLVIYLGGALRDAHVSITTVFYGGTVGMAICAGLLWLIRPRSAAKL